MVKNLFSAINADPKAEISEVILHNNNFRIEKIISFGQISPENFWYDQAEDEWVCLLDGNAILELDNGCMVNLSKGEHYFIPAHQKHRVSFTSSDPVCIWLAVFSKP